MKIALITIHNVTNYGAILQAYATKVVLSRYGEVNTINYSPGHLAKHMNLVRFERSIHGFKKLIHDLLNLPRRLQVIKKFRGLLVEKMGLTEELTREALEIGKADGFDVYVCGSDQIWNPYTVNENGILDPIFFLSFVKVDNIKISYASSIGHHQYSEEEKVTVKRLLEGFKRISVREKDGQAKLKEIFPEREIHHVVDPTLLLSKEEWFNEFDIVEESNSEKYILVYSVPRTVLLRKAIEYFSKKLGLKVVSIDKMLYSMKHVDNHINNAGPKDYLRLFANASFIITDSFHGTCFSVNFKKPFACIAANIRVNRQESLLSLLGIKERIMYKEEDFSRLNLNLDYEVIGMKLDKIRKESLAFIDSAIRES